MQTPLLTVLEITLAISPLMLAALLFARFGRRFSAACHDAILFILLLRLAIPLNFTLPLPALTLTAPVPSEGQSLTEAIFSHAPPSTEPSLDDIVSLSPGDMPPWITDGIPDHDTVSATRLPTVPAPIVINPVRLAALLWAAAVCIILGHQTIVCLSTAARLRRWKRPIHDSRVEAALQDALGELGMRRDVTVWQCGEVGTPMLHGLLHPEILLPHVNYTDEQLRVLLRHELIHCRRGDIWRKLAATVAAAIHCFNPLVWLVRRQMFIQMELSCDEAVFRTCGISRQSYGETMLTVAREGMSRAPIGLSTQFRASAKTLRGRFASIMDATARRRGIVIIALVLVTALVAGGLISCGLAEADQGDKPPVGDTPADETTTPDVTVSPSPEHLTPSPIPLSLTAPITELATPVLTFSATHSGIDYILPINTLVYASVSGTVTYVGLGEPAGESCCADMHANGECIKIAHASGAEIIFCNIRAPRVKVGDTVSAATALGFSAENTNDAKKTWFHMEVRIDGKAVDPLSYLRTLLTAVNVYWLDSGMPRLHSMRQLADSCFTPDTVTRICNEYTMLEYLFAELYGEDHRFGEFTLTTEQLTLDGHTMDSVWIAHEGSYKQVKLAMTAGGGSIYLAEYDNSAHRFGDFRAVTIGNAGVSLGSRYHQATAKFPADALFPVSVWLVRDENYEVKLTGEATVKIERTRTHMYDIAENLPTLCSSAPISEYLTRDTVARLGNEYAALRYFIDGFFPEPGMVTHVSLMPVSYSIDGKATDSLWALYASDREIGAIAMTPGGGSLYYTDNPDGGQYHPVTLGSTGVTVGENSYASAQTGTGLFSSPIIVWFNLEA